MMATERRIEDAPGHGLYVDAIDAKPIDYAFTPERNIDDEISDGGWAIIYPDVSEWMARECWQWMRDRGQTETPEFRGRSGWADVLEAWRDCVRDSMYYEPDAYAPMMNYAYPLPDLRTTPEAAQTVLEGIQTVCVVVTIDDAPYLALAGGGMDFSWDICRAYIALGYYPPVHFAGRLPRQGDADLETARISAEACRIAARWAAQHVEEAERMVEYTADLLVQRDR